MDRLKDIADIQNKYQDMCNTGFNKKQLCELVIPFRDKYHLSDKDALGIVRGEYPLAVAELLMSPGKDGGENV